MTESERAIEEYLARGGKVVRVLPGSYPLEADAPSLMEQDGGSMDVVRPNEGPATSAGFSRIPPIGHLLQTNGGG
jgi:hypothetical protein